MRPWPLHVGADTHQRYVLRHQALTDVVMPPPRPETSPGRAPWAPGREPVLVPVAVSGAVIAMILVGLVLAGAWVWQAIGR